MVTEVQFRQGMSQLAGGVTVVTCTDYDGAWRGFTASDVCSLSLKPPMVLVCLDRAAECHPTFQVASSFAVNILASEDRQLAKRFATKGEEKFAGTSFHEGPLGAPVLPEALATIECHARERIDLGDHTILTGAVERVVTNDGQPLVYYDRDFWRLMNAQREECAS
ncbi:MAG: flavin reductase [Streptosporangiales bacterium]|nr:flavin reductase [Streptosporangiales bacterium]